MEDIGVRASLWNAESGLYLTPDLAFYGELQSDQLIDTVAAMHRKQLLATSFDSFVDEITDRFVAERSTLVECMMVCAAITNGYRWIRRWKATALMTAVNIHLNTINAPDICQFARIVPRDLADMRIANLREIDHDLLWRILVTEPWLSYAERARAQYQRMQRILSRRFIERLADIFREIFNTDSLPPPAPRRAHMGRQKVNRSIRRAFKLHERLFGLDNLRILMSGRPLLLNGRLYDYLLQCDPGDLIRYTEHTKTGTPPVHMTLLRKRDQTALCTICVYFADTPMIDHLIAFTLHIRTAENEFDLLRTAQVQNATSAFFTDPILPEMKGLLDPVDAPATIISNLVTHAEHDYEYQAMRDHVMDFEWHDLVHELMGYPRALLDVMAKVPLYSPWNYIYGTEETKPIVEQVQQCFAT